VSRLRAVAALSLSSLIFLTACSKPPKMGPHAMRVFRRPAALVDTAVMGSEVVPEARIKAFKKGNPQDYIGHGGRRIRVFFDRKKDVTVVMVTYRGFKGAKGAERTLDKIEAWMKETDGYAPTDDTR